MESYDFMMIAWGVVFCGGALAFLYKINQMFQREQRQQEAEVDRLTIATTAATNVVPLRRAA